MNLPPRLHNPIHKVTHRLRYHRYDLVLLAIYITVAGILFSSLEDRRMDAAINQTQTPCPVIAAVP